MNKHFMPTVLAFLLIISLPGLALAGDNAAKACKDGGTDLIATVLEEALFNAHGV